MILRVAGLLIGLFIVFWTMAFAGGNGLATRPVSAIPFEPAGLSGIWAWFATPTATASPTGTHTTTFTPTRTITPSSTWTPTRTLTPTSTPSLTSTRTARPRVILHSSPTPTRTRRPTRTSTSTVTHTPTATPTPTCTPIPQPTPDGVERTARVPILMYHHVVVPPAGANAVEQDLSVSPARFDEQLNYLKEAGYETISTIDLVYHLTLGTPLPAKPIIITFDDGYNDNYEYAFPLLQKYGFTATFYIITDYIDRGLPRFMTWDQIEEMAENGMEIGSHSRDHPDMRGRPADFLVWQILGSKQTLESHVDGQIHAFSYPSGTYDAHVIEVLRSAQFWGAVTTKQGATHSSDSIFQLTRVRVRGGDSLYLFDKKLNLDW